MDVLLDKSDGLYYAAIYYINKFLLILSFFIYPACTCLPFFFFVIDGYGKLMDVLIKLLSGIHLLVGV